MRSAARALSHIDEDIQNEEDESATFCEFDLGYIRLNLVKGISREFHCSFASSLIASHPKLLVRSCALRPSLTMTQINLVCLPKDLEYAIYQMIYTSLPMHNDRLRLQKFIERPC